MDISKNVKSLRLILIFFLVIELFFAFMSWAVTASGSMKFSFNIKQQGIFLLILIIVSIINYYRGNTLYGKLIKKIRTYPDISVRLKEYRNAFVIRTFILNIIPFMIFFVSMFTGLYALLILGIIVLLVIFRMLFPKTDKILLSLNIIDK